LAECHDVREKRKHYGLKISRVSDQETPRDASLSDDSHSLIEADAIFPALLIPVNPSFRGSVRLRSTPSTRPSSTWVFQPNIHHWWSLCLGKKRKLTDCPLPYIIHGPDKSLVDKLIPCRDHAIIMLCSVTGHYLPEYLVYHSIM